eukprot:TRINITY_DN74283_c0_g1_i1.p1 TRINITY_DN74283_c0_g1~~TRINITY_DN74283_c0_g1_i1.p1  ORF type:complete len:410 (+),score=37.43 TRINITY_DN74283_c0_g1_i1:75-1304(+)
MTSMSFAVADALINNHLASFVNGIHAVSKAFVGERYDISFALVKFPATTSAITGRPSKIAALRVYSNDLDETDLTESIRKQDEKRVAKLLKAGCRADAIGDLCQLCLAESEVDHYPSEGRSVYISASHTHYIYIVYYFTFPDAKYLPLTEDMVEFICDDEVQYIGEVTMCYNPKSRNHTWGCDGLVIDAGEFTDDGPEVYGWYTYIVSDASATQQQQFNGVYMESCREDYSRFYRDKSSVVNINGNGLLVLDCGWKLLAEDLTEDFRIGFRSKKSMTVSGAPEYLNGWYHSCPDDDKKYKNATGGVMYWAIASGNWALEHPTTGVAYAAKEAAPVRGEYVSRSPPTGKWLASTGSATFCIVDRGSVCFFNETLHACKRGEPGFIPEGTWSGRLDAGQTCTVTHLWGGMD